MPKISVIVPVYKVEAYLPRCVGSILSQSFSDFELILVDDGSPDSCGALCDGYAAQDGRVRVIHQENAGLSAARNAGIDWAEANSSSTYFAFVDSDDWVHPDFLKTLWESAEESGCLLSTCGFFRTESGPFPEFPREKTMVLSSGDFYCSETIHGGVTAVAWNKLYHRSLFAGVRYPVGKLHEDEFTTYRLVYRAEKIAVTQAPLYAYFQNAAGIMGSKWSARRMQVFQAFEEQMAFAKAKAEQELYRKAALQSIYAAYEQLSQAEKPYRSQLRKILGKALKAGAETGVFPRNQENLWAYEEAYPCKVLWWLAGRLRGGGAG